MSSRRLMMACVMALGLGASPAQAAVPDPGGSERHNVRLPVPGAFLGVNENLGAAHPPLESARAVRAMGGRVVRTAVAWNAVQPRPGEWDETEWARLERANRDLRRRGVRMLAVLGFAPAWARETGSGGRLVPPRHCTRVGMCEFPPRAEMNGHWRAFVREAVRRLPGAAFQTWNEPNMSEFWTSGPDPERWAQLHVLAWREIKSLRPDAFVVACGCAGAGPGYPGSMRIGDFLARAYRASPSIAGRYDAIGLTVYPQGGRGAGRRFGSGTWFAEVLRDARRAKRQAGDGRLPLVLSEVGLWTSGPAAMTQAEQARGLVRIVRRSLTMPDVAGVILHRLRATTRETAQERSMSLLRPEDGSPTLGWCWLVNMASNPRPRGCPRVERPRASIRRGPPSVTGSRRAVFALRAAPRGARLECSVGGRSFRPCGRRLALTADGRGRQALRVRPWLESGVTGRAERHVWTVR